MKEKTQDENHTQTKTHRREQGHKDYQLRYGTLPLLVYQIRMCSLNLEAHRGIAEEALDVAIWNGCGRGSEMVSGHSWRPSYSLTHSRRFVEEEERMVAVVLSVMGVKLCGWLTDARVCWMTGVKGAGNQRARQPRAGKPREQGSQECKHAGGGAVI